MVRHRGESPAGAGPHGISTVANTIGELFGEEPPKGGAPSLEPQGRLPAGSFERRRYNAPAWIALLNQTAEACERAATRDHGHDLDALADLEIVSFELWGAYRMTICEAVRSRAVGATGGRRRAAA